MNVVCERCGSEWGGVEFRDESDLPEHVEEGFFCDECFLKMQDEWWDEEKLSYMYDNEGNRADHPDYDPDNAWMEDRDE